MKALTLLAAGALALALAGCNDETDVVVEVADPAPVATPDPNADFTLHEGTSITVLPEIDQDPVMDDGPTYFPATLISDDPKIASITFTAHEYAISPDDAEQGVIITGVSPGLTTLHFGNSLPGNAVTVRVLGFGQ